jgi:hypothetical protein
MCFFGCLHRKRSIRVRSDDQSGCAVGPLCQIHLPGYVVFSYHWTSSPQCTGAILCLNHNLYLTARGMSLNTQGRTVFRKSRYHWAVSFSSSRLGPTTRSLTIPAQMLTLKWTWYPCLQIAWGLSCAQRWLLMLNTPSCIKRTSSAYRMVCIKSSSTVGCCHSHLQNCIHRGWLSGYRCVYCE